MRRRIARGVGDAAPYETNRYGSVGANSVRPGSFTVTQDCTGEQCSPLQECGSPLGEPPSTAIEFILAPEGANGEK